MAWAWLLWTITAAFVEKSKVCAFVASNNNNHWNLSKENVGSFYFQVESSIQRALMENKKRRSIGSPHRRVLSFLPRNASSDDNNNNENNNFNANKDSNKNKNKYNKSKNADRKKGDDVSSSSSNNSISKKEEDSIREKYERELKKARLQAEINSLLDDEEDLIVDMTAEMLKVDAIAPAPSQSKEEMERAWVAQQKEDDLFSAIDAQDYAEASRLKQDLDAIHVDDCGQVLHQNTLFYKAFSKRNFNVMSDLWLHDATVTCIHPSSPTLMGSSAVLSSFEKLLQRDNENNDDAVTGSSQIELDPNHIRLHVRGNMAIVTCEEHVYQKKKFVRGKRPTMELVNKFLTTNVFRKVQGQWFMVHHHATWHPDTLASKKAIEISQQNKSISSSSNNSKHKKKLQKSSSSTDNITTESFLGLPPSTEGLSTNNPNKNKNDKSDDIDPDGISGGPVRRVFMGSLGDLLNGGLSDILSGAENNEDDNGDDYIDEKEQDLMSLFDDDDDEGFEEDDDDEEMEENEDDDNETINIVSRWPNGNINDKKKDLKSGTPKIIQKSIVIGRKMADTGSGKDIHDTIVNHLSPKGRVEDDDDNDQQNHSPHPKDALRQNCIAALRRLAKSGVISKNQKRMLLTDIITCSAKGEFSMVEVAYELLCGEITPPPASSNGQTKENNNKEDRLMDPAGEQEEIQLNDPHGIDLAAEAEEDFAEQCLAFVMGMSEYPAPPGSDSQN